MRCLKAVTTILDQYDSDKMYPFYGFGGVPQFMGMNQVSHCFPLNGSEKQPHIDGVENVIKAYKQALPQIKMMGPTKFSYILKECKAQVEAINDPKTYHICLLLTDGEIHDMEETIEEIADIANKNLPVSIIIVGVGSEDFSNMAKLDGDDMKLREGMRDIVQFVKFQDVIDESVEGQAEENLASMVLEEIPTQFVNCYNKMGYFP